MKVLRSDQVKELDKFTIENEPILPINLMERAARACTDWITKYYGYDREFKIFVGPGNNGGDGLAIARMLSEKGYYVEAYVTGKLSDNGLTNYNRLVKKGAAKVFTINGVDKFPMLEESDVLIDALFGSGLDRPIEGYIASLVNYLNDSGSTIISIDIPSGLFAEDNTPQKVITIDGTQYYANVIKATYTLTFELPFISFFFADDAIHIGHWEILPIGLHTGFIEHEPVDNYYITHADAKELLKARYKFAHKGNFGHALLITGGFGKMGASILAAKACLKSGVGLVSTHTPQSGIGYLQTAVPENMISADEDMNYFSSLPENFEPYNTIGIGPGLGINEKTQAALKQLLEAAKVPMVVDADALNILSQNKEWLKLIPENSILTPHPKELDRLTSPKKHVYSRIESQTQLSKDYKIFVVQKGGNSGISDPEGVVYYNSSGNPGLATGGTGDVLTGIITSLLAQGYASRDAAVLGPYVHGLAGDLAAKEMGEEAVTASEVITFLGKAFKHIY